MTDDVLKRSVTEHDAQIAEKSGTITVFLGPTNWSAYWGQGLLEGIKGANGLPLYGSKNGDVILSESPLIENMWASAVHTAISQQVALGYTIKDATESTNRIKRAQDLMLNFDGAYGRGLSRHLRDFLLTDNGGFIEIVRQSNAAGSRVLGLRHLDSLRCYRTGDPRKPVVYVDSHGTQHLLNDHDVIMLADMPASRVELRGFGICAARRAWETILKMVAIETYVREKVSGRRNLAIHIINGITPAQLDGALQSSESDTKGKGFVVYKGSTIIPMLKDEPPGLVTIPLAEIPDGFNADSERKDAYLRYANALGVFVGEIQPLSGQGLGTGQQSAILEESAQGRGLAAWRKQFAHAITNDVLPTATTFAFAQSDTKDKQAKAQALGAYASALKTLTDAQIITANQALNVLVDDGYMPKEFLQTDNTAGGSVTDDDSIASGSEVQQSDGNQETVPTVNGQVLDVQKDDNLRRRLKALSRIAKRIDRAAYRTRDTWAGESPAPVVAREKVDALSDDHKRRAMRLAKSVMRSS